MTCIGGGTGVHVKHMCMSTTCHGWHAHACSTVCVHAWSYVNANVGNVITCSDHISHGSIKDGLGQYDADVSVCVFVCVCVCVWVTEMCFQCVLCCDSALSMTCHLHLSINVSTTLHLSINVDQRCVNDMQIAFVDLNVGHRSTNKMLCDAIESDEKLTNCTQNLQKLR